jgi:hypothetical protein
MPERPRPDLDHVRDALRRHDDRPGEDEAAEERDEPEREDPQEGDEEPSS